MAEVLKTFPITIDLRRGVSYEEFELVEGDNGNELVLSLVDDNVPVDLSECDVRLTFSHSGTTYQQDSTVVDGGVSIGGTDDNEITCRLFSESYSPDDITLCEIQIYSGATRTTLSTTPYFAFTAHRSATNDETVQAQDKYPILVQLIADYQAALAREQSDYTETDTDDPTYIRNKPVVGTNVQDATQNLTVEATLSDTDTVPFYDASATAHRKSTWANIIAKIRTALFGSSTGILKADGSGTISVAAANEDYAAATHASRHASGAADAITPAAIGAAASTHKSNHAYGGSDVLAASDIGQYGTAPLNSSGVVAAQQARCLVQTKYASFTLADGDAEKFTLLNSTSTIVVTIPTDATRNFPIGTAFNFVRQNTGAAQFSYESGAYVSAVGGVFAISAQTSSALLVKTAANGWWLSCG